MDKENFNELQIEEWKAKIEIFNFEYYWNKFYIRPEYQIILWLEQKKKYFGW